MSWSRVHRVLTAAVSVLLALAPVLAAGATATEIWFTEKEPATGPYVVRMLVTEEFLRLDDGADSDDFMLFDRSDRIIYSVSHEERRILVLPTRPVKQQEPAHYRHQSERVLLDDGPRIAGNRVTLYRLYTNGAMCVEVAAAESLLPQAVAALFEFHAVLAGEQAAVAERTPEDLKSACDLTDHVFRPGRHLEYGFPVTVRFSNGRERLLNRYNTRESDDSLFILPADYRQLRTPG